MEVKLIKKLDGFELNMEFKTAGRRLGILGESGSGKSMTMKMIAGLEDPDEGRVELNGRKLYDSEDRTCLRPQQRRTGYLFQSYALFPNMTVAENIAAGIKDASAKDRTVKEMVSLFHLEGLEERFPSQLSGGQKQRTALARLFASSPEAILLDEPFSALDAHLKDVMQEDLLEILADYEGDVIMVSHDRDDIYKFCDEMIVIDGGRVIAAGKTADIFKNPGSAKAASLTGCKNISHAERRSDRSIYASDWGVILETACDVPGDITHVGIRAHDIVPVWDDTDRANSIPFDLKGTARLPFETHYYIRVLQGQVCWFIQRNLEKEIREKGDPSRLYLPAEKLLLMGD
ncbi:MAG: ATP-binding cassette domain-containing protein [Eubacterium sp.]|nr:ATP-binding cassette domain-containing protein [Eubacterium sp.]